MRRFFKHFCGTVCVNGPPLRSCSQIRLFWQFFFYRIVSISFSSLFLVSLEVRCTFDDAEISDGVVKTSKEIKSKKFIQLLQVTMISSGHQPPNGKPSSIFSLDIFLLLPYSFE